MDPAPYLALTGIPYVPIPAGVPMPAPVAQQAAWKIAEGQRFEAVKGRNSMRNQILRSLDDSSLALVNTDMGNRHLTLRQIMTILRDAYAGISATDLRENRAKMGQPYAHGNIMRNWIQQRTSTHN